MREPTLNTPTHRRLQPLARLLTRPHGRPRLRCIWVVTPMATEYEHEGVIYHEPLPRVLLVNFADALIVDVEGIWRNPEKGDHFGLRGIVERARLVGGEAKIESKKGGGTRITIEVPLVKKGSARRAAN